MKLLKNFAIAGSLGLIAFAGLGSASTIAYNQTLASVGDKAGSPGTPAPGFYNGSGNFADNFATLTDGNLQLALRANNRSVGPDIPEVGDNYDFNDNQGSTHQWDFYYSINTEFGGGTGTIGDYTYRLIITDVNTSSTVSYNPLQIDDAYYDGTGVHGGNSNSNSLATQNDFYGIQNAGYPGFGFIFGPSVNLHDTYSITLQALANTQGAVADDLTIRVNGTPEPGTIMTMLGSLGALGLFIRRRKA
ncbi:MAG TPA: PEP-CTERM sorting domain-containing protein [Bryobacteraceae bacterium]|nr:PEP-CTERM sorting domain-containing protein [Bryobacteraceae bacterium]